jgi:hypothetical protein
MNVKNKHISTFVKCLKLLQDTFEVTTSITFTGGEPSLNCDAISYFARSSLLNDLDVERFYIATNGRYSVKTYNEFINAIQKMQVRSSRGGLIGVSNDQYHSPYSLSNYFSSKLIEWCDSKHISYRFNSNNDTSHEIVDQGRGKLFNNTISPLLDFTTTAGVLYSVLALESSSSVLYLSSTGRIVSSCEFDYENIDSNKSIYICDIENLMPTIKLYHKYLSYIYYSSSGIESKFLENANSIKNQRDLKKFVDSHRQYYKFS